jgi:hypothetical protein
VPVGLRIAHADLAAEVTFPAETSWALTEDLGLGSPA